MAYHAEISPPNPLSDSSKLIDGVLEQESVITTKIERPLVFKKVKLLKVTNQREFINIFEIQIWVNKKNIATSGRADSFPGYYQSRRFNLTPNKINDNVLSHGRNMAHPRYTIIGSYVMITLPNDIEVSDIQSIVIYNRDNNNRLKRRIRGCVLQLLTSDDKVVYQSPNINKIKSYYRFDGPDIGNAVLTNRESTNAIINSGDIVKVNINIVNNTADLPINFAEIYFTTLEKTVKFKLFKPTPSFTSLDNGKLNRYLYNYNGINYRSYLPAWNNFSNAEIVSKSNRKF